MHIQVSFELCIGILGIGLQPGRVKGEELRFAVSRTLIYDHETWRPEIFNGGLNQVEMMGINAACEEVLLQESRQRCIEKRRPSLRKPGELESWEGCNETRSSRGTPAQVTSPSTSTWLASEPVTRAGNDWIEQPRLTAPRLRSPTRPHVQRFPGGLVFQAHRLVYHSKLSLKVFF